MLPEPDRPAEPAPVAVDTPVFSKPLPAAAPPFDAGLAAHVTPRGFGLPDELYEARVTVIAALREEGYPFKTIARALKMKDAEVIWCARKARERGLLRAGVAEAVKMLDEEAVPLAIDAVMRKIRKGEDKAVFGVLEGRGILKNYSQVKTENDVPRSNLAFQFNFTGGPAQVRLDPVPTGLPGQVLGAARVDDEPEV